MYAENERIGLRTYRLRIRLQFHNPREKGLILSLGASPECRRLVTGPPPLAAVHGGRNVELHWNRAIHTPSDSIFGQEFNSGEPQFACAAAVVGIASREETRTERGSRWRSTRGATIASCHRSLPLLRPPRAETEEGEMGGHGSAMRR
ncbi:hypothetical protein JCGZ_16361 [Jatropha curcas]|uniref:Uncharacterized protein n=1 Tax=Jatropha curcas TaxID=180498 RepID=A0A067LBB1_JATCU|nr:hypothetical protein JCGZ_16361 [Jatropha curcas]